VGQSARKKERGKGRGGEVAADKDIREVASAKQQKAMIP